MMRILPVWVVAVVLVNVHQTSQSFADSRLKQWTLHASEDGQHPDQNEQKLVWLMNRARQNPEAEGIWLAETTIASISQARKQYRVSERRLRKQFRKIAPKPPAAFDARLHQAAMVHASRLARKEKQNHRGQMKAIKRTGFPLASCRGNVFSYAKSAVNAHAAFNIDWGRGWGGTQRGVGHRKAVMSVGEILDHVGIAVVDGVDSRRVGPMVVVGNYCRSMPETSKEPRQFFVGTVFVDANNNGEFDIGEGVPDVRVESALSGWYSITASGGGYALPRNRRGSGQLEFRSSTIGRHTVLVKNSDSNLLVDLVVR